LFASRYNNNNNNNNNNHLVCLTTVPKHVPKRVLHRVRPSISSCHLQCLLVSSRSSSSCLRLLPHIPVDSIIPSIFSLITCFRRHFLCNMWSVQLVLFPFIYVWYSSPPWIFAIFIHSSHDLSKWSSPSFSGTTFWNFRGSSDLLWEVSKFQHYAQLCSKSNTLLTSSLNLSPVCWRKEGLVEWCICHGDPGKGAMFCVNITWSQVRNSRAYFELVWGVLTSLQTDFEEFAFSVEIRPYLLGRSVASHPTFMLLEKENKTKSSKILYR
jgi:hypothetical protein